MSSFLFPITTQSHLDDLYEKYGVDRAIKLDLASSSETPESAWEGYCGSYISYFIERSLSFPIVEPMLDILAELDLSLTQMSHNFLRHLLILMVKACEKGLLVGLDELHHLCLMKRNI